MIIDVRHINEELGICASRRSRLKPLKKSSQSGSIREESMLGTN